MEPQRIRRHIYPGADIFDGTKVTGIRFKKFQDDQQYSIQEVSSLAEYESGCRVHRQCFGHMCKTPTGAILPPQSMSMRTMEIATEYNAAAKLAFLGDYDGYIEKLKSTNYTKHGTYRTIMSTPVAGSARLIAVPQWEFGRSCIAISKNLASRMKRCRKRVYEDGTVGSKYEEESLHEGDWVILVRPPSLHLGNTQPVRVAFWDKECIGIHPETFSVLHGDFDGDEAHIYPVYETSSIDECQAWDVLPLSSFTLGRIQLNQRLLRAGLEPESEDDNARFLEYSTLSAKQIIEMSSDSNIYLSLGPYSRNKSAHITGMSARFTSTNTEKSFVQESIRGMSDVIVQQTSQGTLGDMSRVSKIVMSCFYRPSTGSLYVKTRSGDIALSLDGITDIGTPSVRGMSSICSKAQQAALDAHRAESKDPLTHDFISDLILGCSRTVHLSPTSKYTFVEFECKTEEVSVMDVHIKQCKPMWRSHGSTTKVSILCEPNNVTVTSCKFILSAYNPLVLSRIRQHGREAYETCRRGIVIVCNYYGVSISQTEIHDISHAFSYMPEESVNPITTREGMMSRKLGWIETLQATDYTKLPVLEGDFESPDTSTASMFVRNFERMKSKGTE